MTDASVNPNPLVSLSATVVVTEFHIKQGYIEFPATWPTPFVDGNYTLVTSISHKSISGGQRNCYVDCGYRDKLPTGFFNVASILPGSKPEVGDVLEVNAFARHN